MQILYVVFSIGRCSVMAEVSVRDAASQEELQVRDCSRTDLLQYKLRDNTRSCKKITIDVHVIKKLDC